MIGKNALNDEPDAIIKSGKLILFFSNKGSFKYLKKLKVFVSHFFSKYCLVIKSVFAFSKAFFIECQTFISISGNILLETSHLQKNVSSKASSPKNCNKKLSKLFEFSK